MKELSVGVDIGGTNSVIGVVDGEGTILGESNISSTAYPEIDDYVAALCGQIRTLLASAGEHKLVGIGIGAPNANYYRGTIECAANLLWKGIVPLVDKIKKYFPEAKVVMTNDANAAAIGEMVYGGAKGMRDFVVVTLGTGLGSGFVAGGQLIYGSDSFAGELGHVIVKEEGRTCGCGRKGCLEAYASASGIVRTYIELSGSQEQGITTAEVSRRAHEGDKAALETYEQTGRILGLALANAVAITSPEAIFFFGGVAKAGDLILEPTKRYMEQYLLCNYRDKVKLLLSSIEGKNAAVLGASGLVW